MCVDGWAPTFQGALVIAKIGVEDQIISKKWRLEVHLEVCGEARFRGSKNLGFCFLEVRPCFLEVCVFAFFV